jgi:hypothetical protein
MAINYYSSIDLLQNQLIKPRIQNEISDAAAGSGVDGQIYFNTTSNTLKVWITSAWYEVPSAGTGYVNTVDTANSTFVNLVDSGTAADPILTASLSATGTPSGTTYLRGDNTWATITDVDTTYDLDSLQVGTNAAITLVGSDATLDTVTLVAGTNVTISDDGSNNITINSTDQYVGTVTSVNTANSFFISGSGGPITTSGSLTYSLSATGTPTSSTYLRGDNTWAALPGPATITLTGEVTGSGTTTISTTVANGVLDIANFTAATIVTEAEGIENNDNDTTLPTSAAVKAYVDSSVAGGLVYQGGYAADTNTPNLDSPPTGTINKGFTYTVTAPGLFFTEQVRVGDVLIAEIDTPTTLGDWTTVQNNIDLADLTTVGIGNVNAGTGISVAYSNGTATVTNTQTNAANTYATTVSATATITHNLGTRDVMIQLYDTVTFETLYADITRPSTATATITFNPTPTNSVKVLVQKIG